MIFFITVITFIAIMFFYKCFYSVSNGIDSQVMRSFRQQQLAIAIVNYAKLRDTTCDKICYRRELNFLRTRITLTNSVSNRLVSNGHFYYSYKICREYYVNVLRANFGSGTPRYLQPYVFKQNLNVDFLSCYLKLRAMADLDYALYWKALQMLSIFKISFKSRRIKKKTRFAHRLDYNIAGKRLLFVWKWLSILLQSCQLDNSPIKYSVISGFENFFLAPKQANFISLFKYRVYRLKMLQIITS